MKGTFLEIFIDYVQQTYGEEIALLARLNCGLKRVISTQNYPREIFSRYLQEVKRLTGSNEAHILYNFGRSFLFTPTFQKVYHAYLYQSNLKDFILALNGIHRRFSQGASEDDKSYFTIVCEDEDKIVLRFSLSMHLCLFIKGLLESAADIFDEKVHIYKHKCNKRDSETCEIVIAYK